MLFSTILFTVVSIGSVFAQSSPSDGKTPASPSDGKTPASPSDGKTPASPSDGKTPASPSDGKSPANQGDQVKVHVVKVGANGAVKFEPNKITAQVGEMVQFQFAGGNHTVAQSTFDEPCTPISMVNPKVDGFYSGYMPVEASSTSMPTYTVMIKDLTPIWIYCAQGQHCQKGMNMVINENTKANSTRSLENFSALANIKVTVQMKSSAGKGNAGAGPGSPTIAPPPSQSGSLVQASGSVLRPGGSKDEKDGKDGNGSTDGDSAKPADPPKPSDPIASSGIRVVASIASSLLAGSICLLITS